ncbi:hypothetical protein [Lewinella sp. W8]|uniref:hypothetical protein n=1 Tax=Lewinella sp. W8 TaxID=2528208 RepID=UPI001068C479|nr:hypothetical protein [Lewinella sp. W8]MTB50834.1 hypothetical protein [Lewinella sp. W8]
MTIKEKPVQEEKIEEPFQDQWSLMFGFGPSLRGSANVWNNYLEDRGFGHLRSSSFFGIIISRVQYPTISRRMDLELRIDRQYRSHRAWGAKLQIANSGVVNGFSATHGELDVKFQQQSLEVYHRWSSSPEMASSTSVYVGPGIHRVSYAYFDGAINYNEEGTWSSPRTYWKPGITGGLILYPFRSRGGAIWGVDVAYAYVPKFKTQAFSISSRAAPEGITIRDGWVNPSTLSLRLLMGHTFGKRYK